MERHTRPTQSFSPQGVAKKQNRIRELISKTEQEGLLDDFSKVDEYQGNAACASTRAHLRLAHTAFFTPLFQDALNNEIPVYAVRSSSQKHICEPGDLSEVGARTILRKIEDLSSKVKYKPDEFFGVSVVEIVLRKRLNGECYWIPHVHSIFAGLSRTDIKDGLKPRRLDDPFFSSPQIHTEELSCTGHIIQKLKYLNKAVPETKRERLANDEKTGTDREGIENKSLRAEFHQWFSEYELSEVVRYTNISHELLEKMRCIEMEKLCRKFVKICKDTPSHVLEECFCKGD